MLLRPPPTNFIPKLVLLGVSGAFTITSLASFVVTSGLRQKSHEVAARSQQKVRQVEEIAELNRVAAANNLELKERANVYQLPGFICNAGHQKPELAIAPGKEVKAVIDELGNVVGYIYPNGEYAENRNCK